MQKIWFNGAHNMRCKGKRTTDRARPESGNKSKIAQNIKTGKIKEKVKERHIKIMQESQASQLSQPIQDKNIWKISVNDVIILCFGSIM